MTTLQLLQLATKNWIEAVQKHYENTRSNELTQIHMRGHFSGWSEREIVNLANKLAKNDKDYPLHSDKDG